MTKKDYVRIARAFCLTRPEDRDGTDDQSGSSDGCYDYTNIPEPGDSLQGLTVIASVYLSDTVALLVLLRKSMPFFLVAEYVIGNPDSLRIIGEHLNIVHAIQQYQNEGGDV